MHKQKKINKKRYLKLTILITIILIGVILILWSVIDLQTPNKRFVKKGQTNKIDVIEPNKQLYQTRPIEGELIGNINIPVLNKTLSLYEGTNDAELKKGVGHFIQSVLPGEKDNSVISGHRTTVFNELGKLIIGDLIFIETQAGKFTYKVTGTRIVDKDDKTVIVPSKEAILTLTTCYPFYYIGSSSKQRYIVLANLVTSD